MIRSSASIADKFRSRFPNAAQPGKVDLAASAEPGSIESIEAAGIRSFGANTGKQVWIKVTEHFAVPGDTVYAGEFLQLPEADAKRIQAARRCEITTEAAANAAQAEAAKGKK